MWALISILSLPGLRNSWGLVKHTPGCVLMAFPETVGFWRLWLNKWIRLLWSWSKVASEACLEEVGHWRCVLRSCCSSWPLPVSTFVSASCLPRSKRQTASAICSCSHDALSSRNQDVEVTIAGPFTAWWLYTGGGRNLGPISQAVPSRRGYASLPPFTQYT